MDVAYVSALAPLAGSVRKVRDYVDFQANL
jgi:hypothetical protein